jgi:predicted AAA+ superfamily ATPase
MSATFLSTTPGALPAGLPANNVLLWGARGMGKSSLVKSAHAELASESETIPRRLKLVEIHREDINSLPELDGHSQTGQRALHPVLR